MASIADAAHDYLARGWQPVLILPREKRPKLTGWEQLRYGEASLEEAFGNGPANVGVHLGSASNGLTDVDLDCLEAVLAANSFFSTKTLIFGRASARFSHYLYITRLCGGSRGAVIRFDDIDKSRMLEIRIGPGHQTIFPPSVHPSGEVVEFESVSASEPMVVDDDELIRRCSWLATAALLGKHWAGLRSRHDAHLMVAHFACHCASHVDQIVSLIRAIINITKDEETADRFRTVTDAWDRFKRGEPTPGYPKFREMFGKEIADKAADWLGYKGSREWGNGNRSEERRVGEDSKGE